MWFLPSLVKAFYASIYSSQTSSIMHVQAVLTGPPREFKGPRAKFNSGDLCSYKCITAIQSGAKSKIPQLPPLLAALSTYYYDHNFCACTCTCMGS